jgi:hypothetical protein
MGAFEQLISEILWMKGYWVRPSPQQYHWDFRTVGDVRVYGVVC